MALDHDAKMALAEEVGCRVGNRFGDAVLFGCVTGSVARGDDTARSDLDLLFLTRKRIRLPDMSPDGYREFVFRGLKTQIEFRTAEEAREILGETGPDWPFQVKDFLEPTIIHGDDASTSETVTSFRDLVGELPEASFRRGAGHALMWAQASRAKVENALEEEDLPRAIQGAHGMGQNVAAFVALVNRRYYRYADLRLLEESASFRVLPRNYRTRLVNLYLAKEEEILREAAGILDDACVALAEEHGIRIERLDDLEALGL